VREGLKPTATDRPTRPDTSQLRMAPTTTACPTRSLTPRQCSLDRIHRQHCVPVPLTGGGHTQGGLINQVDHLGGRVAGQGSTEVGVTQGGIHTGCCPGQAGIFVDVPWRPTHPMVQQAGKVLRHITWLVGPPRCMPTQQPLRNQCSHKSYSPHSW
jgi:hypothetical protein